CLTHPIIEGESLLEKSVKVISVCGVGDKVLGFGSDAGRLTLLRGPTRECTRLSVPWCRDKTPSITEVAPPSVRRQTNIIKTPASPAPPPNPAPAGRCRLCPRPPAPFLQTGQSASCGGRGWPPSP